MATCLGSVIWGPRELKGGGKTEGKRTMQEDTVAIQMEKHGHLNKNNGGLMEEENELARCLESLLIKISLTFG